MLFFNPKRPTHHPSWKTPSLATGRDHLFVTFHLGDSLSQTELALLQREKELWLRLNPKPRSEGQQSQFQERFIQTVDRWLDAGYGRCILARQDCQAIMSSNLMHFDGARYELGEFVVMPNHVHAIVAPIRGHELNRILHSWKSFTAHEFNRVLGSSGRIWHHESFDHIVRSAEQLAKFETYIRNNPKGA